MEHPLIITHFSEETKKKMFLMMDKDGSGDISKTELSEWIKSTLEFDSDVEDASDIEGRFDEQKVESEFNRIDTNGDGALSYDEMDCACAGQDNSDDLVKCAYNIE